MKLYKKILRSLRDDWSPENLKKLIKKHSRPTMDSVISWACDNPKVFNIKGIKIDDKGDWFEIYVEPPPLAPNDPLRYGGTLGHDMSFRMNRFIPLYSYPFSSESDIFLKSSWDKFKDSIINEGGKLFWTVLGMAITFLIPLLILLDHWLTNVPK